MAHSTQHMAHSTQHIAHSTWHMAHSIQQGWLAEWCVWGGEGRAAARQVYMGRPGHGHNNFTNVVPQ